MITCFLNTDNESSSLILKTEEEKNKMRKNGCRKTGGGEEGGFQRLKSLNKLVLSSFPFHAILLFYAFHFFLLLSCLY